jgi:hypothetical protein
MVVSIFLYFGVMSIVTIFLDKTDPPDSTMWALAVAWIVLFIPLFIIAGNYAFSWKAKDTPPISESEIQKLLSEFMIDGMGFSYERNKRSYVLSPINSITRVIRKNTIYDLRFYTRIWIDAANKKAKFCDYLIQDKHTKKSLSFSIFKTYKKGMILFEINQHSSNAEFIQFSSNEIHKKLISTFIDKGWNIKGKII